MLSRKKPKILNGLVISAGEFGFKFFIFSLFVNLFGGKLSMGENGTSHRACFFR
jgi:hypothetical protein